MGIFPFLLGSVADFRRLSLRCYGGADSNSGTDVIADADAPKIFH
jgi:hypothetical protein